MDVILEVIFILLRSVNYELWRADHKTKPNQVQRETKLDQAQRETKPKQGTDRVQVLVLVACIFGGVALVATAVLGNVTPGWWAQTLGLHVLACPCIYWFATDNLVNKPSETWQRLPSTQMVGASGSCLWDYLSGRFILGVRGNPEFGI